MPAYVVIQVRITDQSKYDQYKSMTPATVEKYGGRFIVRGGAKEDVEGEWDVPRVVIIEFPSMERARQWYHSPEYQAAKAVRKGGAEMVAAILEGYSG